MSERITSEQFKAKVEEFKTRAEAGEDVEKEAMTFFIGAGCDLYDMFVSMEKSLALLAFYAQNADERARNALGQL